MRSRGLGAALTPPLALLADRQGSYFDPTAPSEVEALIARSVNLPNAERQRARRLVSEINKLGLSKYGQLEGSSDESAPANSILVVGQVEDDASVLLGAGDGPRTNADLLAAARAAHPDAHLIYKPHPDVLAGYRKGALPAEAHALADQIVGAVDPATLLEQVSAVWTITSTLGFEALLRGRPVTCTGLPFYAGWGLTNDLTPAPERRQARPDIIALAHAVLIEAPRYIDPESGTICPPEVALMRLSSGETPKLRFSVVNFLRNVLLRR